MNRVSKGFPIDEKGQSIVIVAVLLSFVFLALAALAVDGTIIYLRRRQLQNIADAAALGAAIALSQGKTDAEAYQEAMDTIAANKGQIEWYSTDPLNPNPPTTNLGTGTDLSAGVEITDSCDVRVALRWADLGTYFAQFVGRDRLQVGARAHAGCNRAGGLMPIAVKRFGDQFDWDTQTGLNTNNATIYCEDCNTLQALIGPPDQGKGNAHDFLRVQSSDVITQWPGWPSQLDQKFQSPSPHANLASGNPGREYYILGGGVKPNMGTGVSYAGLVNLDLRNLATSPIGYNGVDPGTQTNVLKDLAEYYIRRGYCCDIPKPGDQIAIIDGNSTNFSAQAFQQTYAISDVVAVIVYDGHVRRNPNLTITGDIPNYKVTHPTTTTISSSALTYAINLEGIGFASASAGMTMNVEGLNGLADWSLAPTTSPVLPYGGNDQRTLTLTVTPTLTTTMTGTYVVTGTRMFYVSAFDDKFGGTGIRRYWAGITSVGDTVNGVQRDLPAVTAEPNLPYISVAQGDPPVTIRLELKVWGLSSGNRDVTVSAGTLPAGFRWRNPAPPWVNNVRYDRAVSFNIKLEVDNTATVSSVPYAIPLTVSAPGMQGQTFNLYVLVKTANATTKDYVVILGYAALQVTGYPNANSVRGRIISELANDPSDLKYGLRARLIPW